MIDDHEKALEMYKRRNGLLKRIHAITKSQLKAVEKNRIRDFLRSSDERERYFEELIATEMDIKALVIERIRTTSPDVASLDAAAREMLERICLVEPEVKEKLVARLQDVEKEIGNIRKGRNTLKAYHARRESGRGREISEQG